MVPGDVFEVEVKVRLRDRAALEARLAALGARRRPPERQQDLFFAHPQRDFAATDEALRLRDVAGALELTYKGPRLPGSTKTRVEHTVTVHGDPTALLAGLGFVPAARLAKTRVPYELDGVHVDLDHVDGVGDFVEVEALGADRDASGRRVEAMLARLGLEAEERVLQSYLELAQSTGRGALSDSS